MATVDSLSLAGVWWISLHISWLLKYTKEGP
jgi:hypothetical protein